MPYNHEPEPHSTPLAASGIESQLKTPRQCLGVLFIYIFSIISLKILVGVLLFTPTISLKKECCIRQQEKQRQYATCRNRSPSGLNARSGILNHHSFLHCLARRRPNLVTDTEFCAMPGLKPFLARRTSCFCGKTCRRHMRRRLGRTLRLPKGKTWHNTCQE